MAKSEPARWPRLLPAKSVKPSRPCKLDVFGFRFVPFDKRMRCEVVRVAQLRTAEQRRSAYREDYLAEQWHLDWIAIGERGRALHHGEIDPVARKVRLASIYRGNPNFDLGVKRCKPA